MRKIPLIIFLFGTVVLLTSCVAPVYNQPPVAVIKANPTSSDVPPLTVHFDGSDSYDPDGSIVSYIWDFGDGTFGNGITVSHVYTKAGDFTVTLTVSDDRGATGIASIVITIRCDILHEGDLIIEGNEVLTIEGIVYCQIGNIIVKDNATLRLIDAKLIFQETGEWTYIRTQDNATLRIQQMKVPPKGLNEMTFDEKSSVLIEDSNLEWFHCHDEATVVLRNSTFRDFHPHTSCSVEVSDSVIGNIGILLDIPNEQHTVSNLHPGLHEYWNFQAENPEANVGYNIILINTSVDSFDVFNNVGPVVAFINDSTLVSIGCYIGSDYFINNTETDDLRFDQFTGNITFHNTIVKSWISAYNGTDAIMRGDLTLHTASASFDSARIQRFYNVFVQDSNGAPLPYIPLRLYDFDGMEVWRGETDNEGKASFSIVFNDDNYTKRWTLKAPTLGIEREVRFLTDTPILIIAS